MTKRILHWLILAARLAPVPASSQSALKPGPVCYSDSSRDMDPRASAVLRSTSPKQIGCPRPAALGIVNKDHQTLRLIHLVWYASEF